MHRRIFSAISHKDYRQCLTKRMAFTYNAHAEKSAFYYGSGIILSLIHIYAGQILNSLINSILLIDDNLAIHYANPAAQQLLAQSSRKLFGTPLPELLSYFALNIELRQESLEAGQGFTDNEVTQMCIRDRLCR